MSSTIVHKDACKHCAKTIHAGSVYAMPAAVPKKQVMNMMTKPRKWFGQSYAYRALQTRPEISPRVVTHIRFLKKAPYKVSYGEFNYSIQPVLAEDEKTSYIAARMVMANGHVHQPLHEYEVSRRFPNTTTAEEAWTAGFEAREDSFLVRALIARAIEEEVAEVMPVPDAAALRAK